MLNSIYPPFVFDISDQKEITIDETYCWSTDHLGRPIDIYSDPDYRMQCIGYWKENLKSYLITYDQLDAFTKYRCWVREYRDLQITKWHVVRLNHIPFVL